jgi:hypothetical protein
MQEQRLHKYLSSYHEELRAMCFEKLYGRSYTSYRYSTTEKPMHHMYPFVDFPGDSMSCSPPPSTPRSPLPNQVYSRSQTPMIDPSLINGCTSMRGFMYKKSVKNDISIWRRRYFYLLTPEGRLMQYEDDQVRKALVVQQTFLNRDKLTILYRMT